MNKLCRCDNCVRTREGGYPPCEKPKASRPYLGDTPEQLGSLLVADAVMVDGYLVTKQQVKELKADLEFLLEQILLIEHAQNHEKQRELRAKYGIRWL